MSDITRPAISVVTTTYNRAHLLPRVWNSLKNEAVDFEWIVVDDKSTDDTASVVAGLNDPRIQYICNAVNTGGPATGRNRGVAATSAPYVLFLDDDDELYPGALNRMIETLDGADPSIGCAIFQVQLPGGRRWRENVEDGAVYDEVDVVCRRVLGMEKICVYRREVFDDFHLDEDLRFVEGVFVFGLTRKHKILMVNEPARIYHDSGVRITSSAGMVRISPLIAQGYERILANHREALSNYPEARLHYLTKALFRYSVAGKLPDAWRILKQIFGFRQAKAAAFAVALFLLGVFRAGPLLERFRMPLMARLSVERSPL